MAITIIWTYAALFFAGVFTANYPEHAARGWLAAAASGAVIGALHLCILLLFRTRGAVVGLAVAKLIALPLTLGLGLFSIVAGAMGADAGAEIPAQHITELVPLLTGITALPSLLAGLIGAAIGQRVEVLRARRLAPVDIAG